LEDCAKSTIATDTTAKATFPHVEIVRKKKDREKLPSHDCEQCKAFYDAVKNDFHKASLINQCSRHKDQFLPPATPPGYWDLGFPDEKT